MKNYPITIFSDLPRKAKQLESKKISYWLEKLFKQEKEKNIREKLHAKKKVTSVENSTPSNNKQEEHSLEEHGFDDAVRNHAEKLETNRHQLENMMLNSNRIIMKTYSVFPWDFFPTTICIEDTRVTIIYRQLFSSQVYSVDIKDISNVLLERGFLFATIIIISKTFTQNDIRIGTLWKKDAILIRRLIEGLRMFTKHDLDTSTYSVEELVKKLKELSTTEIVM